MIKKSPNPFEKTTSKTASSPILTKNVYRTMDFFEAIKEVSFGKLIRRIGWDDSSVHCLMHNDVLSISIKNEIYSWLISTGDIVGTDWICI